MKYRVEYTRTYAIVIEVEAANREEAINKAEEELDYKSPSDWEFDDQNLYSCDERTEEKSDAPTTL